MFPGCTVDDFENRRIMNLHPESRRVSNDAQAYFETALHRFSILDPHLPTVNMARIEFLESIKEYP